MSDADFDRMRRAMDRLNQSKLLRILAPLVHKGVCLSRSSRDPSCFGYGGGKDKSRQHDAVIAPAEVEALLARDLITSSASGYRLSEAGRAWLKRELAAGDRFQAQHGARRAGLAKTDDGEEQVV